MCKLTIMILALFCVSIQGMLPTNSQPTSAPKATKPVASKRAPSKETAKSLLDQIRPRL